MKERMAYPTDERGVPYAPKDFSVCYDICLKGIKQTDRHHLQNRSSCETRTEKAYSESGSMIIRACICKHQDLHATYEAPEIPDVHTMHDVIQGDLAPREAEVWVRTKEEVNRDNITRNTIPV